MGFGSLLVFLVQQLRWVTQLCSIKFISLLIISLWDICNNIEVGVEFLPFGQLKIFKMAAAKRGRLVMEISFLVGSMKLHILGFWSVAFSKFMGKICSFHDFTLKCTLKYINH